MHNIILFFVLATLAFTAGSFYHSFNLWTKDGKDRDRIHLQERAYRVVRDNSLQAKRVTDLGQQQQNVVNDLQSQVSSYEFIDPSPLADGTFSRFQTLTNAIQDANNTCNTRINQLTAIVNQLVSAANATSRVIFSGTCEFNGLVNETSPVAFTHEVTEIGGLEFYFYTFAGNDTTVVVGTGGARVENCVPAIFVGGETSGTIFKSQLDQLQGFPLPAKDYVSTMRVNDNGITFEPIAGLMDDEQTLGWMGTITLFLSFF